MLVRDLDPSLFDHMNERRLEVVVDGLPLFQDAQLQTKRVLLELSSEPRHRHTTSRPPATIRPHRLFIR